MRRSVLLLLLLAAGCGAPAPPPPAPPESAQPVLVVSDQPDSASVAKPADPPFALPSDLGGKTVGRVIHSAPTLPPDPVTSAPTRRKSEPDPSDLILPNHGVVRLTAPAVEFNPPLPAPPPERAAADLGSAAALNPGEVKLPDRPRVKADGPSNPRAADVPMTGWRQPDRVSLDDPTVDPTAARLTFTPFPLPVGGFPHRPHRIPNPFEFKEQMKGKTGRDAEFATTPIQVNPEKK